MNSNQIIVEQVSPFNVATTVDKLIAASAAKNWQNPAVHDLQQSLAKSGKAVNPVKVIEICKPDFSGQMLELNHERIMSVMMPCRISVYLKEDGKTYLALLNGGEMAAGQPGKIAEVMKAASDETFEIIKVVAI